MTPQYVKICGLRTPESVDHAVQHGADAVGFVFAPSVRHITASAARELATRVPSHVETVGVFRAQPIDEVIETAQQAGVSAIQFHGGEPYTHVERARAEGFRVLRAFAIDEYLSLSADERELWQRERLLIDAVEPGEGVPFDAESLASKVPSGWWLLAGGLTPENVAGLIAQLRPNGVDVSSGVESSRGVKSHSRIEAFLAAAKHA